MTKKEAKESKSSKSKEEDKILEELKKVQQERDDYKDTLQRVQADFENYKKRIEREKKNQMLYSTEDVIKKFLPILDNLELALKHNDRKDEFTKGVELIYASIREMLEQEGVKPIPALDLPFDPYRHEALMSKESDKPENTVIEVMQNGYLLHERVLRPAKVITSKNGGNKK